MGRGVDSLVGRVRQAVSLSNRIKSALEANRLSYIARRSCAKRSRMTTSHFIAVVLALVLTGGVTPAQSDSERWLLVEVTDVTGQPLKRACVTFVPRDGEITFRNADSRGRVKLKRPGAGKYRVVVKVDGYEAQKREVTVGANNETVAFKLLPRVYR